MIKREEPVDIIQGYVAAVLDSVITPLAKNLSKLSYQSELRESKRFQEAESKIKDYLIAYDRLKNDFVLRDNVVEVLRRIQAAREANRMTQYLEKTTEGPVHEHQDVIAALAPYFEILKPAEEIRRLQTTLMNQGRIKKMTLPYDEITATLNQVGTLATTMPETLTGGIRQLSEIFDQVA